MMSGSKWNIGLLLAAVMGCAAGVSPATASPEQGYKAKVEPFLKNYCYDCHGDGATKGEVAFDDFTSLSTHLSNQKLWLSVWQNLQSQMMPPPKKAQPEEQERREVIEWIERDVFKLDPSNPDPGRVTIRRLNREEYRNTILDLFGVEFDTTEAFPADDTGYGFDTIGDVLTISPMLMEKYIDAAHEIVQKVLANGELRVPTTYVGLEQFKEKNGAKRSMKNLSFDSNVLVTASREVKHPGPYKLTVDLEVAGSREATVHSAKLALIVNGKEIERRDLGWDNRRNISVSDQLVLSKGSHQITLELVPDRQPAEGENRLHANINAVSLHGPLDGTYMERPQEYRRVFMDGPPPADAAARKAYAEKIIRFYATRAYRRTVDDATLNKLTSLAVKSAAEPGMTFEKGVGEALVAILASPRFLFRAEIQPEPNNPGKVVPIDEFALASRLSYFLWSSLPDDELLALARDGKLRTNLRAQVDRMLKHDKGRRFIRNFAGQWLQTRDVETLNIDARRILRIRDNEEANRIFSGQVRRAMRQETEMLFGHLLRENRPLTELLSSDYTFLNEALANFYGIPGVKGQEMRKVSLKPEYNRGSILTHGTYLVVTSNPTRTSPVKRGLFVLENLLATPAPPAPPNVPELEEAKKAMEGPQTMRRLMEVHREKPLCASCHARMDPIGLALENFNAVGKFRDKENGLPIDTAGQLVTGEKFNNVLELAKVLTTSRRKDFYRCATEKMLTYALGRGVEYYDAPTIDKIVAELERDGGKARTLLYGIVESAAFQKRRGDGDRLLSDAKR
jgi:hypothetical protein